MSQRRARTLPIWSLLSIVAIAIAGAAIPAIPLVGTSSTALAATTPAVAAGGAHTCALIDDGSIKCWGANYEGQLGDGTLDDSIEPVTVVGIGAAVAISAGDFPTDAPAAVINATIVGPQTDGFATIYPCGTIPEASSLNYRTGNDIPNELIAKLSPTGTICIYTYATTNLIIDAVGHVS